jgi:hypothetical protein
MTGLALIVAVSLVVTLGTSADASSCESSDDITTTKAPLGAPPGKAKAEAPIYVEVMSGDVKLNRRLRERVEARVKDAFPQATFVDRAARHAPKGAVGVRLTITSWAPRWTIFYGRVLSSVDLFVRSAGGGNRGAQGELAERCLGVVNQAQMFETDADHIVDVAWREWKLADIHD